MHLVCGSSTPPPHTVRCWESIKLAACEPAILFIEEILVEGWRKAAVRCCLWAFVTHSSYLCGRHAHTQARSEIGKEVDFVFLRPPCLPCWHFRGSPDVLGTRASFLLFLSPNSVGQEVRWRMYLLSLLASCLEKYVGNLFLRSSYECACGAEIRFHSLGHQHSCLIISTSLTSLRIAWVF